MIVILRIEVDDDLRRALAARYGKKGLATRNDIISELDAVIPAHWEDVMDDYDKEEMSDE